MITPAFARILAATPASILTMALNATVHRCTLQVFGLDRGHYQGHTLTLARHPSETDQRMMMRLLTFALNADGHLSFTRGLSQDDEIRLSDEASAIQFTLDKAALMFTKCALQRGVSPDRDRADFCRQSPRNWPSNL